MIVAIIIVGIFSLFAVFVSIRVERKLIHNHIYSMHFKEEIDKKLEEIYKKESQE